MTPQEFIEELVGEDWEEAILPFLLSNIKQSIEDAHRYRTLRDYAKKPVFNEYPRNRLEFDEFDDLVDAKGNG